MPRISVVTAAYNHAQFVRRSVESAQAQTYRDFEQVIVDDGSTDGTADVLKTFSDEILCLRQENRGAHAALNVAIRASSGEYIAILDSDDAWLPHKLERQMQALEASPEAGMVYSFAYTIDEEGSIRNNGRTIGKAIRDSRRAYRELVRENCIPVLTALVRRECIGEVGFFDETLPAIADWDLWVRISTIAPIICVPEPLALYRIHKRNTWDEVFWSGRCHQDWLKMLDKFAREHPGLIPEIEGLKVNIANDYAVLELEKGSSSYRRRVGFAMKLLAGSLWRNSTHLSSDRTTRLATRLLLGRRGTAIARRLKGLCGGNRERRIQSHRQG